MTSCKRFSFGRIAKHVNFKVLPVFLMNNTDTSVEDHDNGTHSSAKRAFVQSDITTGIVVNAFLMFLIVGGNCLVIAAYASNRRLRIGTYSLLVSLAFSDLLVGGVSVPIRIYGTAKGWDVPEHISIIYTAIDIFSAIASNLHLMAISFERFIAVSRPFYYQTLSVRPYAFGSAVSWGLAVLVAALHPGNYLQDGPLKLKFFNAYSVTLFAVCFLAPLVVISIVNIGIFRVAKILIQRVPEHGSGNRLKRERKTAFTLLLMTSLFFIAWFPFFVVNMLYLYCPPCLPSTLESQFFMVDILKWLQYSNSAVNPIIYAFRDTEMRRSFARLLGPFGRLCRINQVVPELHSQFSLETLTRK